MRELDAKGLAAVDRRRRATRDHLWLIGLRALQLRGRALHAQREADALRRAMPWRSTWRVEHPRLRLVAKR